MLHTLAKLNPGRLVAIAAEDLTFHLTLHGTPVRLAAKPDLEIISSHTLRVVYPAYFPAAPMDVYTERPFYHPNVHPETGFICVWATHRVEHTIEHALHKVISMMSGRLYNREAMHRMQPQALEEGIQPSLIEPLLGITHDRFLPLSALDRETKRRTRLS
jgi:hypothetical protein